MFLPGPFDYYEAIMQFRRFNTIAKIGDLLCKYYNCEADVDHTGCEVTFTKALLPQLQGEFASGCVIIQLAPTRGGIGCRYLKLVKSKATVLKYFIGSKLNLPEDEVFGYETKIFMDFTDAGAKKAADEIIASVDNCIALEDLTIKLREKLINQAEIAFDEIKFTNQ